MVYHQSLDVTGGKPPYIWTIASGTLPTGLRLATSGVINGRPKDNGTFVFDVEVKDAASKIRFKLLKLVIVKNAVPIHEP